ncbi:MAG TPA: OmpA family protein, partial [Candidatus Polarisedimenticolia bacterium]|nr:OmpA family protein [Candidatus Polarisedimenticolia bacterium]
MYRGFSRGLLLPVLVTVAFGFMVGCKSAPPAESPTTEPPVFDQAPRAEPVEESGGFGDAEPMDDTLGDRGMNDAASLNAQQILKPVHFDFDKYDLKAEAIRTLGGNAAAIKEHNQFNVRVEGHCDERGTVEYNLALGEKRARAARDYLVSLGVEAGRLRVVSYGKERP